MLGHMKPIPLLAAAVLAVGCGDTHLGGLAPSGKFSHSNRSVSGSQIITTVPGNKALVASHDGRVGPRVGKATRHYIFGIIPIGSNSLADAARNGNINQITTVERSSGGFLPFYWSKSTIVSGSEIVIPSSPSIQVGPQPSSP